MFGIADWPKGRRTYPSAPQTDDVIGTYAKTCGAFVGSVISAMMLLMTPMFAVEGSIETSL